MKRWWLVIFLGVISSAALLKFFDLKQQAAVEGSGTGYGIGISFLLIEINDRVPAKEIMNYAQGFLTFGLILLGTAILLAVIRVRQSKINDTSQSS
ncbi:hypothetical protein [Pseudalkalibacillus salsuginis]|uniref:hypothetical protein n=1 Tax=Pseudalkalibacillus salsuginis TaxID=2910972 RepID=UPI001F2E9626|nr:hypothetical protein [Pseudalkalibacillus salsuginis]MCF6409668.1 hypothetical protein [Pseudalkalibacillus salsuginis]